MKSSAVQTAPLGPFEKLTGRVREGLAPNFRRFARYLAIDRGDPLQLIANKVLGVAEAWTRSRRALSRQVDEALDLLREASTTLRAGNVWVVADQTPSQDEAPSTWQLAVPFDFPSNDVECRHNAYWISLPVRDSERERIGEHVALLTSLLARHLGDERAIGLGVDRHGVQIFLALDALRSSDEVHDLLDSLTSQLSARLPPGSAEYGPPDAGVWQCTAYGTQQRADGDEDGSATPTGFDCHDDVRRIGLADLRQLVASLRIEALTS